MENVNVADMAQKILDSMQKEYKKMKKLNVMILGKTGVGKSTLVNSMFSRSVAETGIGRPVTNQIRKFEVPDFPLAIFDTPGLELDGSNAVDVLLKEVTEQINKGVNSGNVSEMIHCIWYCVSTTSHRFEKAEVDFLKKFSDTTKIYNVPVVVVLTQSYSKKDAESLKKEIEKENLNIVKVIPILAENFEVDEHYTIPAYGLNELSVIMYQILPKEIQKTFVCVQCANLELKNERAQAVVMASTTAAMGIGAVPIPFSDAALLIPGQVAMIAGISAIYGIDMDKSAFISVISATLGISGTTVLGKAAVASLLKLIPGVGSVVGGLISGTAAAALTAALGEAYIAIMVKICKGKMKISDLQTRKGQTELQKIFKEKMKLKRNSNGAPI